MPIQINEEDGGKLVAVQVIGKLVKADYERCAPEFDRLIREHGKLRLLFELTDFHGLEAGALWSEIKLDINCLPISSGSRSSGTRSGSRAW